MLYSKEPVDNKNLKMCTIYCPLLIKERASRVLKHLVGQYSAGTGNVKLAKTLSGCARTKLDSASAPSSAHPPPRLNPRAGHW